MLKNGYLFVIALCAAVALVLANPANAREHGIHVTGTGSLEVVPDMGTMRLHVRREGADASALRSQLDAVVAAVLQQAGRLRIDSKDVTATAVSIYPRYQPGENDKRGGQPEISGLTAMRTIKLILRDLDQFSALLNAALDAGVNTVEPLQPDTSRRVELETQALDLAMADATALADRVADGFGVTRGPVLDVNITGQSLVPQRAMVEARLSATQAAPFSPGVILIERRVQATFAIEPR